MKVDATTLGRGVDIAIEVDNIARSISQDLDQCSGRGETDLFDRIASCFHERR